MRFGKTRIGVRSCGHDTERIAGMKRRRVIASAYIRKWIVPLSGALDPVQTILK